MSEESGAAMKVSEAITTERGQDDGHQLIENSNPETLLTREQLGRALGVKYLTVYRYCKRGMPHYGAHRNARFKLSECLEWLRANKNGATDGKKVQR